jgi:bacterial/archaeal transporter family protein
MSNAYVMATLAMLFWGLAPIFGKLGLANANPLAALTIRSLVISAILLVIATATGQWKTLLQFAPREASFLALEGICAALLGQLAYYYALKFGDVSQVTPVVAAFPIVATLLAFAVFGEQITGAKILAIVLISAGIVLLRH